jgi:hypothetical protein
MQYVLVGNRFVAAIPFDLRSASTEIFYLQSQRKGASCDLADHQGRGGCESKKFRLATHPIWRGA